MKKIVALFLLSLLVVPAYARIEGVQYINLKVNGKVYDVPVGNKEQSQELYFIKKALNGDKEALEILIGDQEKSIIWIGDEKPRWLILHKEGKFEVIDNL